MRRPMTLHSLATLCTALLLTAGISQAAKPGKPAKTAPVKTAAIGSPSGLTLLPAKITLNGPRARQQVIVTGEYGSDVVRDLTSAVKITSANPKVAKVVGSIVQPTGNGQTVILATVGKLTVAANVTVTKFDQPAPVSFKNEMLAALTKAGCNMGACHGSPSGKAGFRLSLRAFDPSIDILTLRQEFYGRRTNIMKPDESLILKKPLMEVAHGGGPPAEKGRSCAPHHSRLDRRRAAGRPDVRPEPAADRSRARRSACCAIRPTGSSCSCWGISATAPCRDVTALTAFSSSNESVATVNNDGLVEKTGRGEAAILARYLDKMETSHMMFLKEVPGFAWNTPPENNFVDQLAFAKLKQLQILPSDLCTDEEFLRRVYLDVIGGLPSIAETQAFLADNDPKKRAKLIDKLLERPSSPSSGR